MGIIVAVFTGKDLSTIQKEGGSGYWVAKEERILEAEYALLIRNHRESWAIKNDGLEHGQAFFIGKISGCVEEYENRKVIEFSEYVLLPNQEEFKNAWGNLTGGQRNPVAYLDTESVLSVLGLNLKTLDWAPLEGSKRLTVEEWASKMSLEEAMQTAKSLVATVAKIDDSQVSIQVNF